MRVLGALLIAASPVFASELDSRSIRGELSWPGSPPAITECEPRKSDVLRAMAPNPYFYFASQADELRSKNAGPILVEFTGYTEATAASSSPPGIDGTIYVLCRVLTRLGACADDAT